MSGPLTLKRNFLKENFGLANLSFQKLQFLDISNFWIFRSVSPFSQQTTTTKDKSLTCTGAGWNVQYIKIATVRVGHIFKPK